MRATSLAASEVALQDADRRFLPTVHAVKKWLGRRTNLNDLASLDQELYDGLIKLKQYDGNVDDLALTFTLDVDGEFLGRPRRAPFEPS